MKSIKELNIWNRHFSENKTNKPPPPLDINCGDISDSIKIVLLSFFITKKTKCILMALVTQKKCVLDAHVPSGTNARKP